MDKDKKLRVKAYIEMKDSSRKPKHGFLGRVCGFIKQKEELVQEENGTKV